MNGFSLDHSSRFLCFAEVSVVVRPSVVIGTQLRKTASSVFTVLRYRCFRIDVDKLAVSCYT